MTNQGLTDTMEWLKLWQVNAPNSKVKVLLTKTGLLKIDKLKLFGLFNVHANPSGSYWDNHVFDLLA